VTRFSGRFGVVLVALFTLALAPIWYAQRAPLRDECQSDAALFEPDALHPGIELVTEGPRATRVEKRRLTGIINREAARHLSVIFTIHRTFGLPNALLQPAASLPGEREPDDVSTGVVLAGDTEIPVHYGTERFAESVRTTAYFMTYRGEPISSPLRARMRGAFDAIFHGRWPITLFVVSTQAHHARKSDIGESLDAWVLAAWTRYHEVCPRP
jgi:hypothetical protein